jgi:hypothetical protein
LYYATIKIETPEASVSGVFNLCAVFSALTPIRRCCPPALGLHSL